MPSGLGLAFKNQAGLYWSVDIKELSFILRPWWTKTQVLNVVGLILCQVAPKILQCVLPKDMEEVCFVLFCF